jgi:hypothetical protein
MNSSLRALGRWLGLVVLGALTGLLLGHLLDLALATISYDYVFPYGHYREQGVMAGVLAGMTAGTALYWLRRRPSAARLGYSWFIAMLIVVTMMFVCGGGAALATKVAPEQAAGKVITTPARHAFCQGLARGAKWGIPLALAAFLFAAMTDDRRSASGRAQLPRPASDAA